MKTKLIFMLIGALLMLGSLKLIELLSPSQHPIAAIKRSEITPQNTTENQVLAATGSVDKKISHQANPISENSNAPIECLPSDISYADAISKMTVSMFNNTEYNDAVSQMELAILSKQLRSIDTLDDVRMEQIRAIAKHKIDSDLESSNELNTDPYILNSIGLLSGDASSRGSQKDQELLSEFERKTDQVALLREQTRVEYEDSLRNILSYEELQEYQQNESALAQKSELAEINQTHKMLSNDFIQLTTNQRNQLDTLLQEAQQNASELLPIGSSLGNSDGIFDTSLQDLSDDDVYTKMFSLLTPEQQQRFDEYSLTLIYDDEELD